MEKIRTRLKNDEREEVYRWMAALTILHEDKLDGRIRQKNGGARDLGLIRSKMDSIMEYVFDTVPIDQLITVKNNVHALKCTVGVKPVSDDSMKSYGLFLTYDQLDAIIKSCEDHCIMCNFTQAEIRKCRLRAVLDQIGGYSPQCGLNV